MNSLWNDHEADTFDGDLGKRVYTSRLLGLDPDLVLHGGGNTSVKLTVTDLFGDAVQLLYVKGSGHDLATIDADGFAPVRMDSLLRLAGLERLSDAEMARQLRLATMEPKAPSPSVEAILHAVLPFGYVDHTHADDVVTVTNTPDGEARLREIYGDRVVVIPYVMPGFALSRLCAETFPRDAHAGTEGMVLLNHGLFTFGETAKQSYERTVKLVTEAQAYLEAQGAWAAGTDFARHEGEVGPLTTERATEVAGLRRALSEAAGGPMIVMRPERAALQAFAVQSAGSDVATRGPATPDHVIRTKRIPMIGTAVESYVEAYRAYFQRNAARSAEPLAILDPAPRVVLDGTIGALTAGKTPKDARVVADIYEHTVKMITRAERLGGWRALPEGDIFDVEYWELEQAKLAAAGAGRPFDGEVVLITGAASGIGKACVDEFRGRGAAVVGVDIAEGVSALSDTDVLGLQVDITDTEAVRGAIAHGVARFGGVDMLVLNAGVFPPSKAIAELPDGLWRDTMAVNVNADLALLREAHPFLRLAPRGGRVAVIASKNVPAPGPGASAYSASKAALNQLARVAALEWGKDRIRVNTLHPDAVFDTGLWTDELLSQRAEHYGLTVQQYKTKNVLGVEIRSADVARLAADICGPNFIATTGAQIPVDGGNDRVI